MKRLQCLYTARNKIRLAAHFEFEFCYSVSYFNTLFKIEVVLRNFHKCFKFFYFVGNVLFFYVLGPVRFFGNLKRINYGLDYPNVTSRQCSASQLIADAGLAPFTVKDIIMVIRPYPIRISNKTDIGIDIYSGDYAGSKELSWEEIKERCNANIDLQEYTTVTKKVRRVFEMNWNRLKYNVMINKPTQIALNFVQYIDWKAYRCNDYNNLPIKVKDFIHKIEEITNVPVTLIGTGKRNCDIIDLR